VVIRVLSFLDGLVDDDFDDMVADCGVESVRSVEPDPDGAGEDVPARDWVFERRSV